MIDERAGPPAVSRAARRLARGLGALALALVLVWVPAPATAAGVAPDVAPGVSVAPAAPTLDVPPSAPDVVAGPGPAAAVPPDPPPEPSIMALDAMAHEHDKIAFTPGGRVTIPFRPRLDDGWTVDDGAPSILPPGAATGRALAASRQGSVWSPTSTAPEARPSLPLPVTPRPVDGGAPGTATPAMATSATVGAPVTRATPAATDLRRQVFGFLPYWELNDASTRLTYDLLSTIAYFGVGADAQGNLIKRNRDGSRSIGWAGWTSSRLTSVIQAAHRKGTRVVLTVQAFAWTTNQATNQAALLDSPAARLTLARQIAAAVRDRGADGVNLDFEPLVSGRSDEFVALVRTIRAELKKISRGYQLTFDTMGSIGNYPIEAAIAPGGADAIFIMGYDYRTAGSSRAGSIAPLTGSGFDLVDTILSYTDRVPASRLILGLPYYGRAWSTVSAAPRAATQTGTKYGPSASVTYANAVALAKQKGRRYDSRESSAWIAYRRRNCSARYGCVTTWREVYYDDAQSLRAKYDTINRYGLRGSGIWALGYDGKRADLERVIVAKFLHDTTPPATGIDVLSTRQLDQGFVVRWSALDMNPIRNYDVQVSIDRGPWRTWLSKTKATAAVWLAGDGHAYAFRARATDAKGNRGRWNIANQPTSRPMIARGGFAVVRSATLTVRSRPDTAGSVVSQLRKGDIVAVTGGPVLADGYRWYQVSGPISTWAPVEPVRSGNWVAGSQGSTAYLGPRLAPNTTIVAAGISGLSFGPGGGGGLGPSAAARAARAFSPNGDGSEDGLVLRWSNRVAFDTLVLRVFRSDGHLAGTVNVPDRGRGVQSWAWNGAVGAGRLPDGHYAIQLVGRAGGVTYTAPSIAPLGTAQVLRFGVTIDTIGPRMTGGSISARVVSPLRDGRSDRIALAGSSTGATRWRLTAAPLAGGRPGVPVRTIAGPGGSPRVSWNGRTDRGLPAPDGRYRLTLAVFDEAGNSQARAWDVVVDGTAPIAVLSATPPAFSPNGDGTADRTVVRWSSAEAATVTIRITHGTRTVRTFPTHRAVTGGAFAWDGRAPGGRVADGVYGVRITAQDGAGNRRTVVLRLVVDRTAGRLRWKPAAFYPQDLDALARTATASFRLARRATTTLQVVGPSGAPVRTAWHGRRLGPGTARWTWDGRDGGGALVPAGGYTLVLTASGRYGTTVLRQAVVVDAFAVSLSATKLRAGQHLTVTFRSVEPLGGRPAVTFDQTGLRPVRLAATAAGPGRWTVTFRVAKGGAGPASIRVAATDAGGHANVTLRSVSVR